MRLTLRTLLAYLDDILEPEQARDIGRKAAESPSASTLIGRIREVTRRRRLTAPALSGPGAGLDPNMVAEYLDNTLSVEGVGDVEQVCLESDVHLAEVAACHQVLTLVLGEPVTVVPESRERMYALGASRVEDVLGATALAEPVETGAGKTTVPVVATAIEPETEKSEEEAAMAEAVQQISSPIPSWKRSLPYVLVTGMVLAWLSTFVFLEDPISVPGGQVKTDHDADLVPHGDALAGRATVTEPPAANTVAGAGSVLKSTGRAATDAAPALDDGAAERDSVPTTASPSGVGSGDSETVSAGTKPAAPIDTLSNPANVVPRVPLPPTRYLSTQGVLLRRDAQGGDWMVMPRSGQVRAGERLACPAPFVSVLGIAGTAGRISLLEGTVVTLAGTAEANCETAISRGRVIFHTGPPTTESTGPVVIRVTIGTRNWRLELTGVDASCGIEVRPRFPTTFEQDFDGNWYLGGITVASGTVRWQEETDSEDATVPLTLSRGDWLSLAPSDLGPDSPGPKPLAVLPAWLVPEAQVLTSAERTLASRFAREFDPQQPIRLSVVAAVKDSLAGVSQMAAECLALTGHVEPLVQALAESEHAESREAAFDGLRMWLVARPGRSEAIKIELGKFFEQEDVEAVHRLLWGFDKRDGAGRETSRQLVDWLDHGHVAIREMAFYHVSRITGRKYEYRADAPAGRRNAAVARWHSHLERNGGLVTP